MAWAERVTMVTVGSQTVPAHAVDDTGVTEATHLELVIPGGLSHSRWDRSPGDLSPFMSP